MRASFFRALTLALSLAAIAGSTGIGLAQTEPTFIIVTNRTDEVNADASTVANLQANPGPDGISLREAILTTNNDPGSYAIGFDPALDGRVIVALTRMETLTGGGVSINGDIDEDGNPDVTIRNDVPRDSSYVLAIASGGNQLEDLILQGAFNGALIGAAPMFSDSLPTGQTFAGNVLRGLVIKDVRFGGIAFMTGGAFPGCEREGCMSNNTWTNTRIVGNTIETRSAGVEASIGSVSGDHIDGLTIADNKIRFVGGKGCRLAGFGINLDAGAGGRGTVGNRITDPVVSGNVITGEGTVAIRLAAGGDSADNNRLVGARVTGNRVNIGPNRGAGCKQLVGGIFVATGDGASDTHNPNVHRVRYPENNLISDVTIRRNSLAKGGIRLMAGCCGARRNVIRDVDVSQNTIDANGLFPGIGVYANWEGGQRRATESNRIAGVTIDSNKVSLMRVDNDDLPSPFGGISVGGGNYTGGTDLRQGTIKDVRITDNRVDTSLIGINVVGGWGFQPGEAIANAVTTVVIRGNRIVHAPMTAARFNRATKGINLLGGGLDSHRNRVTCFRIRDNLIAGVRNPFSVLANYTIRGYAVSSGNVVRRGCP